MRVLLRTWIWFLFVAGLCVCVRPALAQQYSSGVYTLICKTSGLALDNEGSTNTGNAVWQWSPQAGNTNQEWEITSLGNGYYNLICVKSGMALDNGGSSTNGAVVTQYTAQQNNTNQEWSITSAGNGYYQLICRTSGLALDNSGATGNGGTVWQWSPATGNTNQEWLITMVPTALPGTVQAENYAPGGQGVGYSVGSVNGSANSFRGDGVDLEATSDLGGGYDIGWSSGGQWFKYNVNVSSANTYPIAFRVANGSGSNATFHLANSSGTNLGEITVPPTGGWQTWTTVTGTIALPAGVQTLTLDQDSGGFNLNFFTVASLTPTTFPALVVPEYSIGQVVVAAATPQEYGAVANGTTDCTTAFQNAINAVATSHEGGGGVLYVPAGKYYFSGSLTVPSSVTLQGDWADWTTGTSGAVGTTFLVTANSGNATGTPFLTIGNSVAIRDINFWYPNQNAGSITPYPYTIQMIGDDCVVNDVALVNSYQGILDASSPNDSNKFVLSTVVGSPLYMGIQADACYDVPHADDIRFSPNAWSVSKLTGAPAAASSYATWMMAHGTAIEMLRIDGWIMNNDIISGYNIGLDCELSSNGNGGCAMYQSSITNCNVALMGNALSPVNEGGEFSECTLSGVIGVDRTNTSITANLAFEDCSITGTGGTAVSNAGPSGNGGSWMSFDNCSINGTMNLLEGVFNVTNSTITAGTQCTMSAGAVRAAFTGCAFSPSENIVNNSGNSGNLIVNSQGSSMNDSSIPTTPYSTVVNNYLSRQPANTSLFNAASYGATGIGTTDDTAAIQSALNAAGANGGGIVYLQPGLYHTSGSLTVPGGVELRGCEELAHNNWPGPNNIQPATVIEPVGGQGSTGGPPAIVLLANAGVVGLTVSYETQYGASQSSILQFPPTIQGQGANIYVIGVQCDNPYTFIDFDTYSCPNHLIYMVRGWALNTGFHIGNGSTGLIADCHANWTYWVYNPDSKSNLGGSVNQTPILAYSSANLQYNILGNCTETYWGSFAIQLNTFIHFTSENGYGPNATLIDPYCDGSAQGFLFNSTAATNINMVNATICNVNSGNANIPLEEATSTAGFGGTVRVYNTCAWGGPTPYDFNIGGGDIGFELYHNQQPAPSGTSISGGTFHLINGQFATSSLYNFAVGGSEFYGRPSELIGLFSGDGFSISGNTSSVNYWDDYSLSSYSNL